jgi:uncharacterized hydrophobic protein (TIGR00271 family)
VSLVHLRVLCPRELADRAVDVLTNARGSLVVTRTPTGGSAPGCELIEADLAREATDGVLEQLDQLGVPDRGMISLDEVDTAHGALVAKAEHDAPGEPEDAVIWDELLTRTGEESTLSGVFLAFLTLATLLAAIGVVTDSQITIVGAMVVGPEFGPLAALAVGLVRRRLTVARRGAIAVAVGFPVAVVITALLALAARSAGLISSADLAGHRQIAYIYHPGWFSVITALVAGAAGMLSLTSSRSGALIGVFISVTTVPAAGYAAVAGVLGNWHETWLSAAQLGINLLGITVAGTLTLLAFEGRSATGARVHGGTGRPNRRRSKGRRMRGRRRAFSR